jgi:hypothetical protein
MVNRRLAVSSADIRAERDRSGCLLSLDLALSCGGSGEVSIRELMVLAFVGTADIS